TTVQRLRVGASPTGRAAVVDVEHGPTAVDPVRVRGTNLDPGLTGRPAGAERNKRRLLAAGGPVEPARAPPTAFPVPWPSPGRAAARGARGAGAHGAPRPGRPGAGPRPRPAARPRRGGGLPPGRGGRQRADRRPTRARRGRRDRRR